MSGRKLAHTDKRCYSSLIKCLRLLSYEWVQPDLHILKPSEIRWCTSVGNRRTKKEHEKSWEIRIKKTSVGEKSPTHKRSRQPVFVY